MRALTSSSLAVSKLPMYCSLSTKLMYRKTCLRSNLQVSNRCLHSESSETRWRSRLISFNALYKLVEATEAAAIVSIIWCFSFSRLNGLRLFLDLSLDDLKKDGRSVFPSVIGCACGVHDADGVV